MSLHLFSCADLADVQRDRLAIIETVKQHSYALVRGLCDGVDLRSVLRDVFSYANTNAHSPSQGLPPEAIRKNMSKWSIGGNSTSQLGISRFMLTLYNPLFEPDCFGLHQVFKTIIAVRDTIAGRAILTDEALLPAHFNACRIQIYPAGGGFMSGHVDSRASSNLSTVTKKENDSYIQCVLLLTQKGVDYHKGGAFVRTRSGIISSEENSFAGDILVYDGATVHGVHDIDPDCSFVATDLRGRAVALATIYDKS